MTKTASLERQVAELQEKCSACFIEMSKKDSKISALNSQVNELHIKLQSNERAVVLLKKLFGKFDNKLMGFINDRGKKRPAQKKSHPKIAIETNESLSNLLMTAKICDVEDFFVLKRFFPKKHSKSKRH